MNNMLASNVAIFKKTIKTSGTPDRVIPYISATTIAFAEGGASKDTITDSDSMFIKRGFYTGLKIQVTGAANHINNKTYTIFSVAAGTITLIADDDVVAETAGATVVIQPVNGSISVNPAGKILVTADKDNTGQVYISNNSTDAVKTVGIATELDAGDSRSYYIRDVSRLWFDSDSTSDSIHVEVEI